MDASIEKMREAKLGKKATKETRDKMSAARYGKPLDKNLYAMMHDELGVIFCTQSYFKGNLAPKRCNFYKLRVGQIKQINGWSLLT